MSSRKINSTDLRFENLKDAELRNYYEADQLADAAATLLHDIIAFVTSKEAHSDPDGPTLSARKAKFIKNSLGSTLMMLARRMDQLPDID